MEIESRFQKMVQVFEKQNWVKYQKMMEIFPMFMNQSD